MQRIVVALALIGVVLIPANQAGAQSTEEIQAQIDDAWRELEPLIEQYNKVRSELKANQEKSEELADKIDPLAENAASAEAELADVAVQQYKAGPMSAVNALLSSGSPTAFVDQLSALDQLAREQQGRIDEANETRADYEAQQAEIDALIEEQEAQEADLAERTDTIEADLDELEGMREEAEAQQAPEQAPPPSSGGQSTGGCPAVASSGPGATAAQFACSQVGKPYEYGAAGPNSYDCSGLTQQAWAAAGVSLTHYTGAQWNEGQVVSQANAIPGDLVFFYNDLSHVGLYIGNGLMVDAPQPGEIVDVRGMEYMPIAGIRRPG
jgi:cell wall-associated NlpC family hydrolase